MSLYRLPLPPWPEAFRTTFFDLVVGMMVKSYAHQHINLQAHLDTWMKHAEGAITLLLADCICPLSQSWCQSDTRIWCHGQKNNTPKAAALWSAMFAHARRRFYVKIDTDTVIEPFRLLDLLSLAASVAPMNGALQPEPLVYLGTDDNIPSIHLTNSLLISSKFKAVDNRVRLLARSYLSPRQENARNQRSHGKVTLIQGGFEALSRAAIRALVGTACMDHVGTLSGSFYPPPSVEDIALGLCMHMIGIPPLLSDCIHPWAPCGCAIRNKTVWAQTCTDISAKRRMKSDGSPTKCLAGAVSLHRMRRADWYHSCWTWMRASEQSLPPRRLERRLHD